ncbi:MAG TPA: HYR domain-containing protein [Verrucomicrobiota bacterium]|nr:hypothetical protein [Verrucomicrobiales bacterium]HRI15180.1 HYR domain-containing protein [Verrucomicrobiota bacterium]
MRLFRFVFAFVLLVTPRVVTHANSSPRLFQGWQNKSPAWTTSLAPTKANYGEGKVIPLRFVANFPAASVHTVRIKYDFSSGGTGHFFDYLRSFDATEAGVQPLAGITLPANQRVPLTWPIPIDTSLSPPVQGFVQEPGQFTTYNISQLSVSPSYDLAGGVKDILVTFTVAGTARSGSRTVVIAYGGHLATEHDWGLGGGASTFTGTSRKAYLAPDRSAALKVSIDRNAIEANDREAPVLTLPADYLLTLADGQCQQAVDYSAAPATAVDNRPGAVTLIYDPPAGTLLGPGDHEVTVTATDIAGNKATGTFNVRVVDNPNVSWVAARPLNLTDGGPGILQATFSQCVSSFDQSRWFRFSVRPGERVFALLTDLPQNYDLVLFKDIQQAYLEAVNQAGDLPLLTAQFAADAFSPAAFSTDAFSPVAFSPAAFSPAAFSPAAFSPAAFSPAAYSPAAFSPAAFSPDAYAPAAFSPAAFSPFAFSPAAFSPAAYSPAAFSPAAYSPAAFSPAAFSEAQIRSVIAVSAFGGNANEGLVANTWNSTGEFYVRVRGRNGVFDPGAPFQLTVYVLTGACENVQLTPPPELGQGPAAVDGDYRTLILTDLARIRDDGTKATLVTKLDALAARPEVNGRIIDLSAYPRVEWLNVQADANVDCPFAKNLVAGEIHQVIRQWRALNPIENVVLIGDDGVIPFFRYPDQALLGPEENYIPPMKELTASQASLRLNYVLGQDAYGASCSLELKSATLPLPEIPAGRLVETSTEIIGMIQAYLDTPNGVVPTPTSALVTGYDFLSDVATKVQEEFEAGMGTSIDTLIDAATIAPANGWTANELRESLLGTRHDLVFLAGHFSAFSALAADYVTYIIAAELEAAEADFKNSILISAGCHSGYSAVDLEGIPLVTPQPDWAQAAARRQATLVAGTGYQYGDTDFIEYSERIYLQFAHELRLGSGPVSVGQALLRAKRHYLATTPVMRGIHEKAFLESTLFGLPMLSVNLPTGRLPVETDTSVVGSLTPAAADPGQLLGLASADLSIVPSFTEHTVTLQNIEGGGTVVASYLEGGDGTLVNPAEPILPLEVRNVTAPNTTLRGVGWRGGTYVDQTGVIPLTGAATTEIRGVHATFLTDVLYPIRFWSVNYFDAVCGTTADATRLYAWPAQFLSDHAVETQGMRRKHTLVNFRLFYSNNSQAYDLDDGTGQIIPADSSPPSISGVFTSVEANKVKFQVYVTGNPAAGIQEVWVTYTAVQGSLYGNWQSLNLVQDTADTTLWQGELDLTGSGAQPGNVRFAVQAVNGLGLVAFNARLGAYHTPGENDAWATDESNPTSVNLLSPPAEADFGDKVTFSAAWNGEGNPTLGGRQIVFSLGDQQVFARTDAAGVATATLNLLGVPGTYELKATFQGEPGFLPSSASRPFVIKPTAVHLELDPSGPSIVAGGTRGLNVLLSDKHGPLIERTVMIVMTGPTNVVRAAITDLTGRARLEAFSASYILASSPSYEVHANAGLEGLPSGSYNLSAHFGDVVTLPDGVTVVDLRDVRYLASEASATLELDSDPPALGSLTVNQPVLRPPDHRMVAVTILPNFTDSNGPADSRVVSIVSSEAESGLGGGDLSPDFEITGPLSVRVRAERDPTGIGRIYAVLVETNDSLGNRRWDVVTIRVPL